jgi:hypothetical protein
MVWELSLRDRFAGLCLFRAEICNGRTRDSIERNLNIFAVPDSFECDMRYFFVRNDCGIVCRDVAREFGEV